MKIDKKQIRQMVRKGLDEGKTKDELFDHIFSAQYNHCFQKEIAETIQYVPEKWRIRKYGIINTLFLIVLIMTDLSLMISLKFEWLVIPGLLTWLVAARMTRHYIYLIVFGAVIILSVIGLVITGSFDMGQNNILFIILSVAFSVVSILFGIFMPKYLTPDYTVVEETFTGSDGKMNTRKKVHFE
jgi:hypothetical protein